jgi:hypothetical protein
MLDWFAFCLKKIVWDKLNDLEVEKAKWKRAFQLEFEIIIRIDETTKSLSW